jgi:hypothetical protein
MLSRIGLQTRVVDERPATMNSLTRQIHSIERKLNVSCSRCPKVLVLSLEAPELTQALPENIEEWPRPF